MWASDPGNTGALYHANPGVYSLKRQDYIPMYIERSLEPMLNEALQHFPVVLLTGARQVGKSTLVMRRRGYYLTLDDINLYTAAKTDPRQFVRGLSKPVIIDEIQKLPEILVAIKEQVDRDRTPGRFLITGSANILGFKNVSETLAGRVAVLELYPFSTAERFHCTEFRLIDALFDPESAGSRCSEAEGPARTETKVSDPTGSMDPTSENDEGGFGPDRFPHWIIVGGYPEPGTIQSPRMRQLWFSSYVRTYIERDVRDIGHLRNLDSFIRLVSMAASRSGNVLNKTELSRATGIDQKTLGGYLTLLEQVYQLRLLASYSSNIGKRFSRNPKLFLTDTGVLCHLLGIHTVDDLRVHPFRGAVFETFVYSELMKAITLCEVPTRLYYYRTREGREIDFILERGQELVAVEIKWTATLSNRDFRHLESLQRESGGRFQRGVVLYAGQHALPFGEKMMALPIDKLISGRCCW